MFSQKTLQSFGGFFRLALLPRTQENRFVTRKKILKCLKAI